MKCQACGAEHKASNLNSLNSKPAILHCSVCSASLKILPCPNCMSTITLDQRRYCKTCKTRKCPSCLCKCEMEKK